MLRPDFPLDTERLLLRPFEDADLDFVSAVEGSADVVRYLYIPQRSREEARGALERRKGMRAIDDRSDGLRLAAVLRSTGAVVGDFSLQRTSREHLQGEIGFIVDPAHQGRGYATEASALLLRLAFEDLGLHRVVGRIDGRNVASARLLERLGMRREAHFRENELVKGGWTDEVVYALLASEWRERRGPGR